MLKKRVPWWMYLTAAVYTLTFCFNARQEGWGPANTGWVPLGPTFAVANVAPGSAMAKAGLRAGDVLETANGRPLTGMPDWFVARAHFERDHPIELQVLRGGQHVSLPVVITAPAWRTWSRTHLVGAVAFYFVRFILLVLAMVVAFSRPGRFRARLVALMLAVGAVAEGYPSSGWAGALHHLPAVLAVPICLATASCLMASLLWLPFFATFRPTWLSKRWRRALVFVPGVVFGLPMLASAIEMIYAPSVLARPWPQLLSATPVRLIQDIAGVSPLLFLNVLPAYGTMTQRALLELWFTVSVLYFAAGFLILIVSYRVLDDMHERRRLGTLAAAVATFGLIVAHNILGRNWRNWFGSAPPGWLGPAASLGINALFLFVPLTLAYYVLTENRQTGEKSTHAAVN